MEIDYKAIGRRIKAARVRREVTRESIAEQVQMSLQHVENIEAGSTRLSLPTLVAIANATDTSVDELLCDHALRSGHVFSAEAGKIWDDCDDYEIRILTDVLKATKEALRKDAALRTNIGG